MPDDRLEELERWRLDMEKRFAESFPAGDYGGHRRAHEVMMEDLQEKKKLRRAIVEKTVAGALWMLLVWLGWAVLQQVKGWFLK